LFIGFTTKGYINIIEVYLNLTSDLCTLNRRIRTTKVPEGRSQCQTGVKSKTSQGVIRMNSFNYKGVFTRDRRPKLAAHRIKELWKKN
jgi:hypothetical protein